MASKQELKRRIAELEAENRLYEKHDNNRWRAYCRGYASGKEQQIKRQEARSEAPKVTMTDSNGNMADMTMVKNSAEIVLQEEHKALEQSHKQYQALFAKIIALMVDELGVDIVHVFFAEHEQPDRMAHWGD